MSNELGPTPSVGLIEGAASRQSGVLKDTLRELLRGRRLGHALRALNQRSASISAEFSEVLKWLKTLVPDRERKPRLSQLGQLWIAYNDARNMIALGDPAVRVLGRGVGNEARLPMVGAPGATEGDLVASMLGCVLEWAARMAEQDGVSVEEWMRRRVEVSV